MFDHNIQYKEFVYIFEDIFNNAEPHNDRINRNLDDAEDLALDIEDEFLDELAKTMQDALTTQIASFISEMKQKEIKNGGFPNTELMINALEEAVKFKLDNINNEIFDTISEEKAKKFELQLRDKLDLDPETREWMA
jgi:hypothetical protein